MKKKFLFLLILLYTSISASGQVADGITYQAVALDDKGKEIAGHDINGLIIHSKQISVRFSIISGSTEGELLYKEVHSTYTDPHGLFTLVIGHGDVSPDGLHQKLTDINWGADKLFLMVEIDIRSKGDYKVMGIQQMMAVPFAFHSLSSSTVKYDDILNVPPLSTVATTGNYTDLNNLPVLFNGDYNTLSNKPIIPVKTSDLENDAGFLKNFTELDPVWMAASVNYYTKTDLQTAGASRMHFLNITNKPTTIAGYGITDAMTKSSPANTITGSNISNWNTAFGWGNHTGLYRPSNWVPAWNDIISNPFTITSPANNQILRYNSTTGKWQNWTPNYLTGFTETDPSWTSSSANYYTKSNLETGGGSRVHFSNIINKPTTMAGYGITDGFNGTWSALTGKPNTIAGYGIIDAMSTSHASNTITTANISNWNTAFSWGNHAAAGYQPFIVPGEIHHYLRGDMTWQPLTADAVGLGNVENISLNGWMGSPNLSMVGFITQGEWHAGLIDARGPVMADVIIKRGGSNNEFLKADGSVDPNNYMIQITGTTDEFTASQNQINFSLNNYPSGLISVKMYVNGVRISNNAFNVSGQVVTYNPANNGFYELTEGDRIQIDYSY